MIHSGNVCFLDVDVRIHVDFIPKLCFRLEELHFFYGSSNDIDVNKLRLENMTFHRKKEYAQDEMYLEFDVKHFEKYSHFHIERHKC